MGILVVLFLAAVALSALRRLAKNAEKAAKLHLPPDFFGTHALTPAQVGGGSPLVSAPPMVSAPRMGEESSSELMVDEIAGDHDLNLDAAEVVSLESTVPVMSVEPRPIPSRDVTLETEVDWEVEHERFHTRYVDARAPRATAAHGLLDELRDPAQARRAVLMAEILGPPASLRDPR